MSMGITRTNAQFVGAKKVNCVPAIIIVRDNKSKMKVSVMDKQTCARQILQEFFFSKVQVTDDSTQLFVAGQSISNFADDIGWCLLSVHGKWVKQSKDQDQEENGVESFGPTGATV